MDLTPVIIGVGESFDPPAIAPDASRSPVALAADAARAAIKDAGGGDKVLRAMDAVAMTRAYPDSTPFWPHPTTPIGNAPGGLARRLGIKPRLAIYEIVGGQSPQALVGEFAGRLARGEHDVVLIAGGDAIASEKNARRAGVTLDWTEEADGDFIDRGLGVDGLLSAHEIANGLVEIGAIYALFDHARRARLRLSREAYTRRIGELLAPFSAIASTQDGAIARSAMSAEAISAPSAANPILFDPYLKSMMAKDGVNIGAALIMTTAHRARELGVDSGKWIYPHACAQSTEEAIMDRPDLGASPAACAAYLAAVDGAGIELGGIKLLDVYSCFPIAIFAVRDGLGIDAAEPRPLTVTGGLPFFGGPGNNYSMHAIAAMARALRKDRATFGAVGANGGFLSKHAVGVYSATKPRAAFADCPAEGLDRAPSARWTAAPEGEGVIETYTIACRDGAPHRAHAIGRLASSGERFLAISEKGDAAGLARFSAIDPLGARVSVKPAERGAVFALV